jgi:hypothetical protein
MPARLSNGLRIFVALLGSAIPLAPALASGCGTSSDTPAAKPPIVDATAPADVRLVMVVTGGGGAASSSSSSSGSGNPLGALPEAGSSSGGGSSSSGGSPESDGGSESDGSDDGSDAAAPAPNCPNYVAPPCGGPNDTSPCDLRSNTCCITLTLQERCIPGAAAKCNSNEAAIHCANACDCSGGNVCCGVANVLVGAVQTVCQSIPDGGLCNPHPATNTQASAQLCNVNAAMPECKNGQNCIAQTCEYGANLSICGLQSQDPFDCIPQDQ